MSRDVIITCRKELTKEAITLCFQPAGTIVAARTISETLTTRTTKLTFETARQAERAERETELWSLETTLQADLPHQPEQPSSSRIKSEIYVVRLTRETNPIDPKRIFCRLP